MTLEAAVLHFRSRVVAWARTWGASEQDAEDIAQEVFQTFGRNTANVLDRAVYNWLRTTTHKKVIEHRRKLRRRERVEIPSGDEPASAVPTQEQALGAHQVEGALRRLILSLEPNRRAVFVRHVLNNEPLEHIAAALGISPKTVSTRLFRARLDLRRAIERARKAERRKSRGSTSYGILPLLLFLDRHRAAFVGAALSIGVAAIGIGWVLHERAEIDEGPALVREASGESQRFAPIFMFAEAPHELDAGPSGARAPGARDARDVRQARDARDAHDAREAGELPERTLVALARRALADGSPVRAREYLDRAARAYPAGSLGPERVALRARAGAR